MSRSLVKSVSTLTRLVYSRIATMSSLVICLSRYSSAASWARSCSGMPMDEKSKKNTSRRLS